LATTVSPQQKKFLNKKSFLLWQNANENFNELIVYYTHKQLFCQTVEVFFGLHKGFL